MHLQPQKEKESFFLTDRQHLSLDLDSLMVAGCQLTLHRKFSQQVGPIITVPMFHHWDILCNAVLLDASRLNIMCLAGVGPFTHQLPACQSSIRSSCRTQGGQLEAQCTLQTPLPLHCLTPLSPATWLVRLRVNSLRAACLDGEA